MSNVYYGVEPYTGKILKHYGIEGMKKGIRRWQYPDGRFNEEGKERYFGSNSKYNSNNKPLPENGGYTKNEMYTKIIDDVIPKNFNIDNISGSQKEYYEMTLGEQFLGIGDNEKKIYKVIDKIDSIYKRDTTEDSKLKDKILNKSYELQCKAFGKDNMPSYEEFKRGMLYGDYDQGKYSINDTFINYMKEGAQYKKLYKDFMKDLNDFEKKLPEGKEKTTNYMYNGQQKSVKWKEKFHVINGLTDYDENFNYLYDLM